MTNEHIKTLTHGSGEFNIGRVDWASFCQTYNHLVIPQKPDSEGPLS